jgi:hypothetical protein
MKTLLPNLFHRLTSWWCERWHLSLENLALRHQLDVLKRSMKRPRFDPTDRCVWLLLSCLWSRWPHAVEIMQADTVRRWRRQGLRHHVRWRRGRKRPGRPPIPAETRTLIRAMSRENRLWGAPRLHGELLKRGITVSRTTVAKYMARRPRPPSPTWRTFWRMHAPDLPVSEVSAELAGRLHAGYTRVIMAVRYALWRRVLGWLRSSVGRHRLSITQAAYPDCASMRSPQDAVEVVRALGRRPPNGGSSSSGLAFPCNPSIARGTSEMRLDASSRHGWDTPPQTACITQDDRNGHRPGASEQAVA